MRAQAYLRRRRRRGRRRLRRDRTRRPTQSRRAAARADEARRTQGRRAEAESELAPSARVLPLRRRDPLHPGGRGAARDDAHDLPDLRIRERREREVLLRVRRVAHGRAGSGTRGAQGRHLPLLRPRRLHGARGADGSRRTCGGSSSPTTRASARELERFGGTVEKFIGDAVMAVFGAPVAHEDDPERAVRAALAIRDALAEEGELEVRIGITTGEALSRSTPGPDAGEGMASGDVVNTAARLQAAAPTGGDPRRRDDLPRDRARRSSTSEPQRGRGEGQGRAGRRLGRADAHARGSASNASGGATLVGREQELTLLRETLARVSASASRSSSRSSASRESARAGSCSSSSSDRERRLRARLLAARPLAPVRRRRHVLGARRDGQGAGGHPRVRRRRAGGARSSRRPSTRSSPTRPTRHWVERHLRPLAGLETRRRRRATGATRRSPPGGASSRRSPTSGPLVLVFEDLHWADDALLDFVDYLVDWASGVPLLVLVHRAPRAARRAARAGAAAR